MDRDNYWFPRKRFGFGWGLPCRWQGWVVVLVFIGALMLGLPWVAQHYGRGAAQLFGACCAAALILVISFKGERSRRS